MNYEQELADAKQAVTDLILALPCETSGKFIDAIHRERVAQIRHRHQEVREAVQQAVEIWNPKAKETI